MGQHKIEEEIAPFFILELVEIIAKKAGHASPFVHKSPALVVTPDAEEGLEEGKLKGVGRDD